MGSSGPHSPAHALPPLWLVMAAEARDAEVAAHLARRGARVYLQGAGHPQVEAVAEAEGLLVPGAAVIGPATGLRLGQGPGHLAPFWLERLAPGGWVIAGRVAADLAEAARMAGLHLVEYQRDPAFIWKNAALTAEAAIRLAIGDQGQALWSAAVAVIGYGHVGSVLAARLRGLAGQVTVLDQRREARAQAEALGLRAHALAPAALEGCDLAFNTVPAPILTADWFPPRLWALWDLASYPGGLAADAHAHPGVRQRYRSALGLPGKVTPVAAGKVAAEVIWERVQQGS